MHSQAAVAVGIDWQRNGHFHCGDSRTIQTTGGKEVYGGWGMESGCRAGLSWSYAEPELASSWKKTHKFKKRCFLQLKVKVQG